MAETKSARGANVKTAAEMRDWYDKNARAIENYTKAKAAIKNLTDLTKTPSAPYSTFDREKLRQYMRNPLRNYKQLIALSRYLYTRSQPYRKMITYNASMIDSTYRSIVPIMDLNKKAQNETKVLKDYYAV